MNSIASSIILKVAEVFLMVGGANQMNVKAQSEADGSGGSSPIAESIRSNGYQSFGLGIGCLGFGFMPRRKNGKSIELDNGFSGDQGPTQPEATRASSKAKGLFEDTDWQGILVLVEESGFDPKQADRNKSYLTSADGASICDISKNIIIEVEHVAGLGWRLKEKA